MMKVLQVFRNGTFGSEQYLVSFQLQIFVSSNKLNFKYSKDKYYGKEGFT